MGKANRTSLRRASLTRRRMTGGRGWLSPSALRNALLVALSLTSGYVDAVSYLGLGAVFTSNMTGNTVLLGLSLAQARGLATLRSGVALAGFVIGVAIGVAIGAPIVRRVSGDDDWPPAVTVACVVEFVVLLALAIWGALLGASPLGQMVYPLIALAAIAMGVQSIAVRALGVPGVVTTYITGTWVSLVAGITDLFARPIEGARKRAIPGVTAARPSLHHMGLQAAVVGVYFVAAFLGGAAELRWRSAALVAPAGVVALVVVAALLHRRQLHRQLRRSQ